MDAVEREIIRMEQNGFALDVQYCVEASAKAKSEEEVCLTELGKVCARLGVPDHEQINWASPAQLVRLFHDTLGLPPSPIWKKGRVRLDKGERKTDEAALGWIRERCTDSASRGLIDELIRLRRIRGAIKYLGKLPGYVSPDGFVHPVSGPAMDSDDRAGTITWRLASKNPEVMQIPTDPKKDWFRIRRAFVAPPGWRLLVADETALEVVILGHLLIELFDDHQLAEMAVPGRDLHAENARLVFGKYLGWSRHGRKVSEYPLECFKDPDFPDVVQLRQDIKAVWYGLMYGKSAYGFATSLRDADGNPIGEEAARKIVEALFAAVPGVPRYQAYVLDYIKAHHGIPGLSGAWCDLSELTKSGDKWRIARAHRIAQNYPMQEGGARIIGHAMVEIGSDPELSGAGLLLERQIHDELDFRFPEVAPSGQPTDVAWLRGLINKHMTSYPLSSTLSVKMGVGDNWDDAKN